MAKTPLSLREFAAEHAPTNQRPRCLLCNVPYDIEQQAQQGHDAKVPYRVICQWLESIDDNNVYGNVTKSRLERHFYEGHRHPDAPAKADAK